MYAHYRTLNTLLVSHFQELPVYFDLINAFGKPNYGSPNSEE